MPADLPLIERKQRQARQRIVAAAGELFTARGFSDVSVNAIAERAEVGRTTFFRHFGDKQEVVFAREQELLDALATEEIAPTAGDRTPTSGLRALEPVVLRLCTRMTADPDGYRRHRQLIDDHPELGAREGVKLEVVAQRLGDLLVAHGWEGDTATLAAEIALACYRTARRTSPDPATLETATRTALHRALELGTT